MQTTAFVTGAGGFLGTELVKVLVAGGHRVVGLASSVDAAERVRRAGGVAVRGDLLEPGQWQDEATADWIFHLPPQWPDGCRATRKRIESFARARVVMDTHLLDATAAVTRRIIYVADTSCYGSTGQRAMTEDEPRVPSAWGRRLTPALERLEGYLVAGLPVVTAFPAWVYGAGSWFSKRVVGPVLEGHRVLQLGTTGPWVSHIHVHDGARALVHLAERGVVGGRYFLVNTEAIRLHAFAETFARLADRRLRVLRVPSSAMRLLIGPILNDYVQADAVFSNIRLRGTGFHFRYPTLEHGLKQVLNMLDE